MFVTHAGKLRNPQTPIRIDHACLGPCATERAPWCDQHTQPVAALLGGIIFVAFQREACRFQFAQLHERWCCHVMAIVEEIACIVPPEPQCADPVRVMHPQQIVRFGESDGLVHQPCPLFTLQTTAHKESSPAIGTRIGKDTECFCSLWRMLTAFEQA